MLEGSTKGGWAAARPRRPIVFEVGRGDNDDDDNPPARTCEDGVLPVVVLVVCLILRRVFRFSMTLMGSVWGGREMVIVRVGLRGAGTLSFFFERASSPRTAQ